MIRGIAYRRHQRDKRRKKAKVIIKDAWQLYRDDPNDPHLQWLIDRLSDNMAICSCYMCGNPRKYCNEVTRQEIRSGGELNETFST